LVSYKVALTTSKTEPKATPPVKPDMKKFAEQNGLIYRKTGLVSALEARRLDIGESATERRAPFLDYAYGTLPEYRPEKSQETKGNRYVLFGNRYLFWKYQDSPDKILEFEDTGVREQVLAAWKTVHARTLAKQAAEQLAAKARKAGGSLKDAFVGQAGLRVSETEPFSWLTYGMFPAWLAEGPPNLSPVTERVKDRASGLIETREAVELPGNDFMQAVFDLKMGQIGVAMNHPNTYVYVVQVTEFKPEREVLWKRFLAENPYTYLYTAQYDQFATYQAWLEQIKTHAGFHSNLEPTRRQRVR
jgi:hypothetical protein